VSIRAVILGASGYGGGELLRLLAAHPSVDGLKGVSRQKAALPFHAVHPNLRGLLPGAFDGAPDWAWLAEAQQPVVFAAMPHGELAKQLPELEKVWKDLGMSERLTLIDLSGDFRLKEAAAFATYYGQTHPCPELLSAFCYGLSEAQGQTMEGKRRIANPGCFATALELALLPLAQLDLEWIAISASTGSSGSGMAPSDTTHHPTRAHDFRAYKVLGHQHEGEVLQLMESMGVKAELSFVPHSAPVVRGIFATLQFRLPDGLDERALKARFAHTYAKASFIRMVEGSPRLAAVVGSNFADLGLAVKGRQAVVMVALDNLLKGMAGQAVQNMNLALGLEERAGLWFAGGYPG
jgi:N-acetyl-gamma-glutamyl-phosphate/LysW-gamma-L-alpha-aminoadipyl-6-phosphate reductase